jgi:hypothetical protein
MAKSKQVPQSPPIEVRNSEVHGKGIFAARGIKKGERLIEYLGERVSHDEADRRYEEKDENDSHTFLFIVDSKTVIDAGNEGNDARFFNHSCDPNCESTVEKRRVYIDALRDIAPGEEMTYDYQIYREEGDPENVDEIFACKCGFEKCRGTMLWPMEPKVKKKAKGKGKSGTRGKVDAAGKKKSAPAKRAAAGKKSGSARSSAAVRSGAGGKSAAAKKSAAGGKSGAKSAAGGKAGAGKKSGGGKNVTGGKSAAGGKAGAGKKSASKSAPAKKKSAPQATKKTVRRR